MFKKLKQKIEQEGSPKDSTKTTDSPKASDSNASNSSPHKSSKELDFDNAASSESNSQERDSVPSRSVPASHSGTTPTDAVDNLIPDDDEADLPNSVESLTVSADSFAPNAVIAKPNTTDNADSPTPRKMNLAATVLKYGEEISAKNQIIAELEKQLQRSRDSEPTKGNANEYNKLQDRLSESQRQVLELESQQESQEETISRLQRTVDQSELENKSNQSLILKLESDLGSRQQEAALLTSKVEASASERESLEHSNQLLHAQINELKTDLESRTASTQRKSEESKNATSENTDVSQLKTKLSRAHSLSKILEKQLEDKTAEFASLVKENREIKCSLESSKQQALNDLLSVSEEESLLRAELSSHVQKLTVLETQYRSQGRLLAEKEKNLSNLEQALDKQLKTSEKERESLVSNFTLRIAELERNCQSLTNTLASETHTSSKAKEELDSLREETLDKQLDDEKQLTDLHEQLSGLRGEIRLLERNKKKELEALSSELSAKDATINRLEGSLSRAGSESADQIQRLNTQIEELQAQVAQLKTGNDEVNNSLTDSHQRLETVESERDQLYLRNAALSSKLETCKMELKSVQNSHEQERTTLLLKLTSNEETEKGSREKFEDLQKQVTLLEGQVNSSVSQQAELDSRNAEIDSLRERLVDQEKTITDKTKSLRIQQQTVNDLKKTIKRELKGLGDGAANQRTSGDHSPARAQDLIERVRSSPALSELDRYDSPTEDNIAFHAAQRFPTSATELVHSPPDMALQHKHEVNGFCGHKDVNFEYLKNVVFSFLISRDSESVHLIKALAVLLEFTPAEERLLKETVEWKMSWWPSTKKPSKKLRK